MEIKNNLNESLKIIKNFKVLGFSIYCLIFFQCNTITLSIEDVTPVNTNDISNKKFIVLKSKDYCHRVSSPFEKYYFLDIDIEDFRSDNMTEILSIKVSYENDYITLIHVFLNQINSKLCYKLESLEEVNDANRGKEIFQNGY